jgi:hypothetical protein
VRTWLAKHPRITLHSTPASGSWRNLAEVFFGIITRQALEPALPTVRLDQGRRHHPPQRNPAEEPQDTRHVRDTPPELFLRGGVAASLVEYARHAPYPVDLQMRHNPKTGADHATLYVGLTSVLDVQGRVRVGGG